jgi:UPF0176 protein
MKYQVLLFYKYVTVENPAELKAYSLELCKRFNLTGRVIIAEEGINYTLEGLVQDTEDFVTEFLKDPRFADTHIKRSEGFGKSFPGLSIKVRKEIVGTQFPKEVDPRVKTGAHLPAEELKKWIDEKKEVVIVDMRNSYEYASGHFKGSEDLGMSASRELPNVIDKLEHAKDKAVVTVCTGGIKCEKMSAYLLHKGFTNVHQLSGGIHTYMEKFPGEDFLGTLYTYDERLVMDFGGDREIVGRCKRCDDKTEKYQNCANAECNMLFLICNDCVSAEGPGFCSEKCEHSTARVVQRVRGS